MDAPILLLGATPPSEMARVVAHALTPTVCDIDAARSLQEATPAHSRSPLHIKVDCGLHRFGIDAAEAVAFASWVAQQPRLRLDGLYSHLSSAEEADGVATAREYERFAAVVAGSASTASAGPARGQQRRDDGLPGVTPGLRSSRSGYLWAGGDYPGANRLTHWPALELHSRISRVHTLAPDEAVGYGRTYIAPEERRVALVSIGYGDGFDRAQQPGRRLIDGRRRRS